jgi:carbonic anhydrase
VNHRHKVASGQHPLALVVTCSDSRLSPELIFDQGLGDLFVIRTAGNVISDMELGSIEYAVEHLDVKTIVVMGHENCGAIEALMQEAKAEGHIKYIIDSLKDEEEMKLPFKHHNIHEGVLANIQHQVNLILKTPAIIQKSIKKPVTVKGVVYDMDNGVVSPLERYFTKN